jgi:hypothetical protein
MPAARYYHTATLLQDGQVLVVGGNGTSGVIVQRTVLYDPDSGTWHAHGSLWSPRYSHTATLLSNGQVLAAGGFGSQGSSIAAAELYTP